MDWLKNFLNIFINRIFFQRVFAYLLIIIVAYFLSDFLVVFLMAFLFAYIFFSSWSYISQKIQSIRFLWKTRYFFSPNLIISLEYLIFLWVIFLIVINVLPKIITDLSSLTSQFPFISDEINFVTQRLQDIMNLNTNIWGQIWEILSKQDYEMAMNLVWNLKTAWILAIKFLLSLFLSYIFVIDRKKLWIYLEKIKNSNFCFLYNEYDIIFNKVVKSFGLIIKAQSSIALVNAFLTWIWLYILWFFFGEFPYLLIITLIVFIFWFIPVVWAFISSLPIMVIAYNAWWFNMLISSLLLIILVHILEAYYLNPKIFSSFFNMPISLTFIILLLWEHFFWIIGLLIGVSVFYFVLELLEEFDFVIDKTNKVIKDKKSLSDKVKNDLKNDIRTSRQKGNI